MNPSYSMKPHLFCTAAFYIVVPLFEMLIWICILVNEPQYEFDQLHENFGAHVWLIQFNSKFIWALADLFFFTG